MKTFPGKLVQEGTNPFNDAGGGRWGILKVMFYRNPTTLK